MRRHLVLLLWIGSFAGSLAAETSAPSWGILAESLTSIPAMAFQPNSSSVGHATGPFGSRWITSGSNLWYAPVSLPSGVLVTGIELQACDDSAVGQITVALLRLYTEGGLDQAVIEGEILGTDLAAVPSCDQFSLTFAAPFAIDNSNAIYVARVQQIGPTDSTVRFAGVRIKYKHQVSPAPASATFADVPVGHQQFRFVEALFSSGITAGCGGGNFCPDAPVTRGQMAVFLSAALGLHFPN
jgi:hypothetical protein